MVKEKKIPRVVIFGRTNVGKSTLLNCLIEKKRALVSDIAGTTRDSIIGEIEWGKSYFEIVDTGGITNLKHLSTSRKAREKAMKDKITTEDIDNQVQNQAREYIMNADVILFVVDTKNGILPQDKEIALQLKKNFPDTKHIILVANKADSPNQRKEAVEFHKLGFGEPLPISATTGSGTGDLLDAILEKFKELKIKTSKRPKEESEKRKSAINVNLIGKPNVGKSSLINAILGEERVIVSPIAHTTREPQDIYIEYQDKIINLIDTAGISKRGKKEAKRGVTRDELEKLSINRSLSSLNKSDICILIIDINEGMTIQESKIVEEVVKSRVSLLIVANKWDLVPVKDTKEYTEAIREHLPFVSWAPIQFVSAKTGNKVHNILDLILQISEARHTEISENALGKFLQKIVQRHRPSKAKGTKHPFIHSFEQTHSNPPRFQIRIGAKDTLHFSYVRFIENRLREKFGFFGTPIGMGVIKNRKVHGAHDERLDKKKLEEDLEIKDEGEE